MMKTKRTVKHLSALLLLSLLAISLCACGSSDKSYASGGDFISNEKNEAVGDSAGWAEEGTSAVPITPDNRKIIKTYTISAETQSFDAATDRIEALVTEKGGYIESSSVSGSGLNTDADYVSTRYASYTLRIPAENAEAFVSAVGDSMHLTSNESRVEDVSDTYYSIEARLEELEAERDSLLSIMASVDSQSDYSFWLTLQQRISEVRQQIAVYQRQLINYDNRISYSTVNLSLREVTVLTASEEQGFFEQVSAGFAGGWNAFTEVSVALIVLLATLSPFLIALGIPAVAIVIVIVIVVTVIKKKLRKRKNTADAAASLQE